MYKSRFIKLSESSVKDLDFILKNKENVIVAEVSFPAEDGLLVITTKKNSPFKYQIEQYEEIYPQEYELYSLNTSYSDIKNPSDMFNAFINREYKSRIKVKKILKAP